MFVTFFTIYRGCSFEEYLVNSALVSAIQWIETMPGPLPQPPLTASLPADCLWGEYLQMARDILARQLLVYKTILLCSVWWCRMLSFQPSWRARALLSSSVGLTSFDRMLLNNARKRVVESIGLCLLNIDDQTVTHKLCITTNSVQDIINWYGTTKASSHIWQS